MVGLLHRLITSSSCEEQFLLIPCPLLIMEASRNNISIIHKKAVTNALSSVTDWDEQAVVSSLYTDSFAVAVLTLGHTLIAANTSARMILIYIPERLSPRTLCLVSAAGWTLYPVPLIQPPHNGKGMIPGFVDQYTKLNIWTLDQIGIKSLVYIDADALVRKNFDELFALPYNFAAVPDVFMDSQSFTVGFNAGVLFVRPNTTVFFDMLSKLETANYPLKYAEQAFLNLYFGVQALRLPYSYNGNMIIKKRDRKVWEALVGDMCIVHYTIKKPFPPDWFESSNDMEAFFYERRNFFNGLWWEEMGWWEDSYKEMIEGLQEPLSRCT
jgi:inositol phosphorylceramide glucuronosyltransferase 1